MNISRTATGLLAAAATALVLVVGACSTTGGVAVRSTTTSPGTTGSTTVTAGTSGSSLGTSVGTSSGTSSGSASPSSTGAVPPPTCSETPNKLVSPTGAPIITVSSGANFFIANSAVEPLSIAVYADGTAISSLGVGTSTQPLPAMTIGYVPTCTLDWAKNEIRQLASVEMGQPNITDQGTTQVVYGSGAAEIKISAYALGNEDQVMTGKAGRSRLITLLAALRAPLEGAAVWAPDRLKIVEVTAPVQAAGPALVWPGPNRLEQVLGQQQGRQRCGVVSGATAAGVLAALGDRNVYSRWTDAGRATGVNIGGLVPGQVGCRQS